LAFVLDRTIEWGRRILGCAKIAFKALIIIIIIIEAQLTPSQFQVYRSLLARSETCQKVMRQISKEVVCKCRLNVE